MTPTRFMVIAGETSGDMLAAELVGELRSCFARRSTYSPTAQPLRSDLAPQFFGAGGPRMAAAGVELAFDLTQHSVIGLFDVLKKYFTFKRLFDELFKMAREREPHVIVCVDFSGFNLRFAAAVKRHVRANRGTFNNWEPKIVQYISPQVWASREGRIYSMARNLDLVLSIFPFEKNWYAARVPKLRVEFVGHPVLDRYQNPEGKSPSPEGGEKPLVVLLPGSRRSELARHFPVMLEAFEKIKAAMPAISTAVVLPNQEIAKTARAMLGHRANPVGIQVQVGSLAETLAKATIALASTGTVTMECAYFGVPTVTLYKTSWSTYQIGKRLVKVKSLTMPNLLAGETIFPEFIQDTATGENISGAAIDLLRNPERRALIRKRLQQIIASLGDPGANRRAAEAILRLVS